MIYCLDARTVNEHFPGIGRYTLNLARALHGHLDDREELVLLRDPTAPSPWNLADVTGAGVRAVDIAISPFSLQQQWVVPARLQQLNVDVYHSPYYLMPYLPRVPALVTVHDLIPLVYPEYFSVFQRLTFAVTVRLAIRRSTAVIAVSRATARDVREYLGVGPRRVRVIHEAADPRFRPLPPEEITATRTALALPERYVLYFGSNKPHKNLVRLVHAWARIQPQAVPLVIAGAWDPRYPDAQHAAEAVGVEDSVRFLGPVPERHVPALYAGATLFVFPSEYEGFGLPVLEAMACGTPVACSNSASLPEVTGDAARLFEPTDVTSIANVLHDLLQDDTLRNELRQRGLHRAADFSWEQTARETLELYRSPIH